MSWEVFDESVDYMQKIRLAQTTSFCLVRAALPFPGPQFANTSFPKEAYFEIRVLPNHGEEMEVKNKITQEKLEEVEVEDESFLVAIGLIGGSDSHFPLNNPGSFLGSVGFDSTGSVYLDGTKLVGKSENGEWGRTGNVIGCGFDPNHKREEEFGHPLYPTVTANGDVSVVVNLGQSPFKHDPANSRRIQNPCFMNKNASTNTAPFNELDSQELFSMGKIDGKWKQWCNE
ncbi:uncharacterized protein LOC121754882 [Salvia splendens]|uniref:uncharacterized protein LOC121754882 n=1 Tax=Salvia splendens TaxID=180675 RepID=UPI001C264D70|nr:uncharacterized protein LOC121754882 [Salvia splendens]